MICLFDRVENIVGKGENTVTNIFSFLYARRRRDVLWDHPWRAGGVQSGAYLQNYSP